MPNSNFVYCEFDQKTSTGRNTPSLPRYCTSALHTSTCVLGVDNRNCYPPIPGMHLLDVASYGSSLDTQSSVCGIRQDSSMA